jgi:hypothetical protein
MPFDQWMLQVHELAKAAGYDSMMHRTWELDYWRYIHSRGLTPEQAT